MDKWNGRGNRGEREMNLAREGRSPPGSPPRKAEAHPTHDGTLRSQAFDIRPETTYRERWLHDKDNERTCALALDLDNESDASR